MRTKRVTVAVLLLALATAVSAAAQTKKDFKYTVSPGSSINVYNEYGPVSVRAGGDRQVVVNAILASDKVEIDPTQAGNRVEFRTHALQRVNDNDGRVEYTVSVPAGSNINIRTMNGDISVENLHGDIVLADDAGNVEVRSCGGGHVHVRTISGPITLINITNGHVEITSVSGNVTLQNVMGPMVSVNTNRGSIKFDGDVGQNGEYSLINNTGDIDFTVPATASMDLTARSISGSVQNDFPLQQKSHTSFEVQPGRAFAGTSNTASSTVELRSFSGTIRVKKR